MGGGLRADGRHVKRASSTMLPRNTGSPSPACSRARAASAARPSCQPPHTVPSRCRKGTAPADTSSELAAPLARIHFGGRLERVDRLAEAVAELGEPQGRERRAAFARSSTISSAQRGAALAQDLAPDQVVGLDAGGAFVDGDDAGVAEVLRDAVNSTKPMPPKTWMASSHTSLPTWCTSPWPPASAG